MEDDSLLAMYRKILETRSLDDPGFHSLWGFFAGASERATLLVNRITDMGEARINDMDSSGIDRQLILLTAPGVQVFDAATATALAISCNDQLAAGIRKYPARYAGLAAVAPQDPQSAAKELERGVKHLGLKGVVINSHTFGEYLDDEKFWDIFAAAEALGVPVYIHPTTPSPAMVKPFLERGLDGAVFGFAVETGLHALRLVVSGVFDRFPKLQVVLGHLGEGLPFWLFRFDFMHAIMVRTERYASVRPLRKKVSDYLKENFYYTTSGMAWEPSIMFVHSVVGADRLMYAMDYPYQFVPAEVKVTDDLPLSAEDKKKFYQTNAERVFGI